MVNSLKIVQNLIIKLYLVRFGQRKMMIKKLKMGIFLWIQGWTGQLNAWAWTKWDILHREDWVKGYNQWKKK